ncbi:hypothetical protein [Thermoactinospora rubra]|uniref:hypothetical protein n=1 Tax=Thermoactinospora rubra TaxID=1088767 RepID=UPI00117C6865|nr:hypothetical protein [Thermoactinospora rubra]
MSKTGMLAAVAGVAAVVFCSPAAMAAAPPKPAAVADKLFHAWLSRDKAAASKVATPAAVEAMFSYVFRAPDKFAGCAGQVCRYVHTSVSVPGGLDGILMVVSGSKVAKVYTSRHLTTPSAAAKHLYAAYRKGDRHRGLEVATGKAVKTLFKVKYDPKGVPQTFMGCVKEPKGHACQWYYEGGAMTMHVTGSKARGYTVQRISYIAD